ncbi:MAG TPA: hypothetical protein VNT03_04360, partial [Baekduia sp.]|nr:hypothetical protein [Baekduia sp.]
MRSLPITPARSAPPPGSSPKGSGPPPGAPGGFAALLDQTSARTAPAEGPKTRPAHSEAPRRRDRDDHVRPRCEDVHDVHNAQDAQAPAPAQPASPGPGEAPSADQAAAPSADQAAAPAT